MVRLCSVGSSTDGNRRFDWRGAAPELRRLAGEESEPGDAPRKDVQLATPEGVRRESIDGVRIREARTIPDDRGTVCVAYDPRWGFSEEPMVYAYEVTIRPGAVKGWILHETYDDRLFLSAGVVKWVLYDDRPESPTRGRLAELYFDEHHRSLLRIPRGVWHAVQNVGEVDSRMVNFPTAPYDYESPDKVRLPLDTESIPYSFER
jgi:dTDP-4-dehydrorhamnose 3,5-epimerase